MIQVGSYPYPEPTGKSQKDEAGKGRPAGRLLAEWVSLGISTLLIVALVGYLLVQAFQPHPPFVPATARFLMDQVRPDGDRFIAPVEIGNRGARALRDLKVEVTYVAEGKEETRDLEVDYLGARSTQRMYLYFDRHPRELKAEATPLQYRLD